ncbi:MAG: thioredoxin family protein [Muribaculaceae bacterium]|nr:thioredoxin family protein [Muribaculaceae bacterium]
MITYDTTHNGQLKVDYKIKEYPTWILYKEGQELMRESGRKTVAQLEDMIVRAL